MEQRKKNAAECFALIQALHELEETWGNHYAALNAKVQMLKEKASTELTLKANTLFSDISGRMPSKLEGSYEEKEILHVNYLQVLIMTIVDNVDFNSSDPAELCSENEYMLCVQTVRDLSDRSLKLQLHYSFYKKPSGAKESVFKRSEEDKPDESLKYSANAIRKSSIEIFSRILKVKRLVPLSIQKDVVSDYMAAIYSCFCAHHRKEYEMSEEMRKKYQAKLNYIWYEISKVQYLRSIFVLMAISGDCVPYAKQLSQELTNKTQCNQGFEALVMTLCTASENSNVTNAYNLIAKIYNTPGTSINYKRNIISQISDFLDNCMLNKSLSEYMGAGLLTLRRMYDSSESSRSYIKEILKLPIDPSASMEDTDIILDDKEFSNFIAKLFHLFCTSSIECLPSAEITPLLPLLLSLYAQLPKGNLQQKQICSLVARCLNNRDQEELKHIIKILYRRNIHTQNWLRLPDSVIVAVSSQGSPYLIVRKKNPINLGMFPVLPDLLIGAEYNQLTYRIFMILLYLMLDETLPDGTTSSNPNAADLLQSEEEFQAFIETRYSAIIDIMNTLQKLVVHKPLLNQISEHVKEFLEFLCGKIRKRFDAKLSPIQVAGADRLLPIVLTLTHEIIYNANIPREDFRPLVLALRELQKKNVNSDVEKHVISLLNLIESSSGSAHNQNEYEVGYGFARAMLERKEEHLQVMGLQTLIDLVKRKDATTCANSHAILALALTTLKAKDSYVFLNCVRLFVALLDVMEAEVLEILCDEYVSEEKETDFRLVVGEALKKITEQLGQLCYKYKDCLLNCYMHGARSSNNEVRMSSLANLGQLCKLVTYQVHNYMEELLQIICYELTDGKYVPSKRSAVLILENLIEGMNSILDHAELLKPIYKLLQAVVNVDATDSVVRTHASNALKLLDSKTEDFFKQPLIMNPTEIGMQIPTGINVTMEGIKKLKIEELN